MVTGVQRFRKNIYIDSMERKRGEGLLNWFNRKTLFSFELALKRQMLALTLRTVCEKTFRRMKYGKTEIVTGADDRFREIQEKTRISVLFMSFDSASPFCRSLKNIYHFICIYYRSRSINCVMR